MDELHKIPCPKCGDELPYPFMNRWVVCLKCFSRWRLNETNTAVESVTIKIENIKTEISASEILRGK